MGGSSRNLLYFLVFLDFLLFFGSADEWTYSTLSVLHDSPKCMLSSNYSCDRVPAGTVFNSSSYWARHTCHPRSHIDYSEKPHKRYPLLKVEFSVSPSEKRVVRLDEGTCQNVWKLDYRSYDPTSLQLYSSGCMVLRRWGCQECQMGWVSDFSGWPGGVQHKKDCIPFMTDDFDYFYKMPLRVINGSVLKRLATCPSGSAHELVRKGCTVQCPENCQFCRDNTTCDLCEKGFVPTAESRHCVRINGDCPEGYYRVLVGCVPCDAQVFGCASCSVDGGCQSCSSGRFLVKGRHYTHCASFCPDGFFFNEKTRLCTQCPPYCKRCHGNDRCYECVEGLYSLRMDEGLKCYNQCPFGYYETNAFPFRCLPCHKSCIGCQRGPTSKHCLNCRFYGMIGHKSRLVACTTRRPVGKIYKQPLKWVDSAEERYRVEKMLFYEVGQDEPIGPCSNGSGYPKRNFTIEANGRIGSNFFKSMKEADGYYRNNQTNSTPSEIYNWYKPYCMRSDCLDHCAPLFQYKCIDGVSVPPEDLTKELGNFDPCPTCLDGYTKCPFSYASCVPACPSGSFRDPRLNTCILTPWPSKCVNGNWIRPFEVTAAYKFTFADYSSEQWLMRIACTKRLPGSTRICNLTYEFETDDGQCRMCHTECLGCTGFGSRRCIECRNVVHPSGHCIPSCPEGYTVKEPRENLRVCIFEEKTEDPPPLILSQIQMFKHTYSSASLPKVALIPAGYSFLLVLLQIGSLLVAWFTDSPEDWDADLISWRYESQIAMEAIREVEAYLKKRSVRQEVKKKKKKSGQSSDELLHRAGQGHPPTTLSTWNRGHGSGERSMRRRNIVRSDKDVIIHRRPQIHRKSTTKFRPGSKELIAIDSKLVERTQRSDESLAKTQRSSIDHLGQGEVLHTPSDLLTAENNPSNENLAKRMSNDEVIQKKGPNLRKLASGGGSGRSRSTRHRASPFRTRTTGSTRSGPRVKRSGGPRK